MRKRLFDGKLYRNGLAQLRLSGVVLAILSVACTALPALLTILNAGSRQRSPAQAMSPTSPSATSRSC